MINIKWFNLLFLIPIAMIFQQQSAAQWVKLNGPSEVSISALAIKPSVNFIGIWDIFAGTWGNGIYLSSDNGNSWAQINPAFHYIRALSVMGNTIVASIDEGIYRSTDNGVSWSDELWNGEILSFLVCDSGLFAAGSENPLNENPKSRILISTDSGATWQETAGSSYFWIFAPHSLCSIDTTLFIVSSGGAYLSKDNGDNWTYINIPTRPFVNTLATSNSNIFAGTDSGLFISTDNGTSWDTADTSIPRTNVTLLAAKDLNILAAMGNILYLSSNEGMSWSRVDSGLSNIEITSIAFADTLVYIGTSNSGVWCRYLSEMITSNRQVTNEILKRFCLADNYPNPFNPSTTIQFSLPKATYVTLTIYNSLGQEVAKLVSEQMSAGIYTTEWNASGFASGVYYYRIEAGSFTETKKLVLLR
jgi:photosystem II stability/assembly factor-like uncharacterized protein